MQPLTLRDLLLCTRKNLSVKMICEISRISMQKGEFCEWLASQNMLVEYSLYLLVKNVSLYLPSDVREYRFEQIRLVIYFKEKSHVNEAFVYLATGLYNGCLIRVTMITVMCDVLYMIGLTY